VLTHLCGTPSMPNLDGAILVVEEVGERPYRLDRMLTQLREAGAFAGVKAVVVGHLNGCEEPAPTTPNPARDAAPAPLDVFRERLHALSIPMAYGIGVGHQPPCYALPLGMRAKLSSSSLELCEDLPP